MSTSPHRQLPLRNAALAAAALVTLSAGGAAFAHPESRAHTHDRTHDGRYDRARGDRMPRWMIAYDRDRDGRLDRAEVDAYWYDQAGRARLGVYGAAERDLLVQAAPTLDRDRDGRLEYRELRAWRTLLMAQRELARLDHNRSGRLNPEEAQSSRFFAGRIALLDLDRNGRVQPAELTEGILDAYRRGDRAFEARFGDRGRRATYLDDRDRDPRWRRR